jgi:hypothetical protein
MFVLKELVIWYIPYRIAKHRVILILFVVGICLIVGLNLKAICQSVKVRWRQMSPVALFVIFYTVFLVMSSTTTAYDPIGYRLLSPIYVPLTLLFLILVQALFEPYRRRLSNKMMDFFWVIALVIGMLVYPILSVTINAVHYAKSGQGYSSKTWLESQTVQYLRNHQSLESECTIYTNAPDAAYILANFTTKMSPARTFYNSLKSKNDISEVESILFAENNKVCIVWFDNANREYLFTIEELQAVTNINLIARLDDGAIYSVTQK